MERLTEVTLTSIAGGAAVELFDRAFQQVLENIQDPNTSAEAKRSVKIEVLIKPSGDRESALIGLKISQSIAPPKPVATMVFLGMKNGHPVAVGQDPRQANMFEAADPSVTPMPRIQENR